MSDWSLSSATRQLINTKEGVNYLATAVFHVESGEQIESNCMIPYVQLKGMNDFQSFGSGVTYFRRYCLSSMLGLVTDKDTDASGEQEKPKKESLDNKRFTDALKAINEGKITIEKLKEKFQLSEAQEKALLL